STRYAACLALPVTLVLGILGDLILRLWMGPQYEQGLVLAILAIGHLLVLAQRPLASMLVGLNLHGTFGFATLAMTLCGISLAFAGLAALGWGLVGSAMAIGLPLTIGYGTFIPIHACRRLGVPLSEYVRAFRTPVACAVPFALCLLGSRILLHDHALAAVCVGLSA